MFHRAANRCFAAPLQARWRAVREEYRSVAGRLEPWPESELYDAGWSVFGLYDFPGGAPLRANLRRCPMTGALVERLFPGHGAAGFSVLAPGTRVRPHQGFPGRFLRCHLPLVVPDGECAIEVAGEVRRWREGEVMVFDDRALHRAWNLAGSERVVLLVDFPEHAP